MNFNERQSRSFQFLHCKLSLLILMSLVVLFTATNAVNAQNAIVVENRLAGASDWDVNGAGDLTIQGFATDISVNKGETVHFKIKTNASSYKIDIYRLGYYQGNGARKVGTGTITATLPQSQPADFTDRTTGLIDCGNWSESANWLVPTTAVSGIYIAKLTRNDNGGASHIVFIVRDDASTSSLFFQTSDATWQAYNGYGGNSLYVGNTTLPGGHAAKVSYNRPFITRAGDGGGGPEEDWLFNAEYPMIRWLERNGYDVTYTTDMDGDRRGNLIRNHKVFLSVGHDEYWSGPQRANVEAARAAGVHLAFFSSNEVYWKTRWEPSTINGTSTPYRTLVCYKEGTLGENVCGGKCDPMANVWTGLWRDGCSFPAADGCRPENALTGQISWTEVTGAINVPTTFKSFRFWRNTAVASATTTQVLSNGTLGYEIDYEQNNGAYAPGRVVLSQTAINNVTHKLSLYRASSGALVFGSGTGQWSWGLDGTHDRGGSTADARVQQATVNLFADMGVQPGSLQTGLTAATASNDQQPPTTTITSPRAGGVVTPNVAVTISGTAADPASTIQGVVAGVEVSVDGGTTWKAATGTTSWTFSWTPPSAGNYTIKSRAFDDLGNIEATATSTNTIQVSTNATNCTPPTATLNAAPANCQGNSIVLKLTAASGTAPYSMTVNNQNYSNVTVGSTFATVSTEQSIWGSTGTPLVPNDNDGQSIEVGVRFRATQNGTITGIRFYKGTANTGTHTGSLWNAAGTTKLASATFINETASGWQEVRFTSPVTISANTTYVASYFSPSGAYSSSDAFFNTAGVSNGSLTALQTGVDGSNGLYKYGATGFPNLSINGANYWVDVLFKPAGTYTFNLTSITDVNGCNNSGNVSSATVTQADLQAGSQTFYQDNDKDGYGSTVTTTGCTAPAGYVAQGGDCNDNNVNVNPGKAEVCGNGIDDNCNGSIDEGCPAGTTYYRDADGDTYGNPANTTTSTTQPAGYVTNNTDCNDANSAVHPGATEVCNGIDDNCDGRIDEGCVTYYQDLDGDTYGNAAITQTATTQPAGYVTRAGDCSDNNANINPGRAEVCGNGIDENCNGNADDACTVVTEQSIWGTTGTPGNPSDYDGQSIEVGVKFRVSQSGTITGIRFYKGSGNTGTHTGNLWTFPGGATTGTKLGTVVFSGETASGWQQMRFATPITVSANTTYVASVFASSGRYASTVSFFTNAGVTNGSITALRAGVSGANGVYKLGASGYPTSSYSSSNYWVDVLFKPSTTTTTAITKAAKSAVQGQETGQKLAVKVVPNPTTSGFKLFVRSTEKAPIQVQVVDALGRVVEIRRGVVANSNLSVGYTYRPGEYYGEAIQGTEKVVFKLIKLTK
jgi:hypothetical protein